MKGQVHTMSGTNCAQAVNPAPRPITARLEENRGGLEEAKAIARRIRAVVDCNRNDDTDKSPDQPVNCIVDDVDKQRTIIGEILSELNMIGQIVGY